MINEVKGVLGTNWRRRDGKAVPEAQDVELGNDAVTLDGTVLYAGMADSKGLVNGHKDWFAAVVYKAYLLCACRIIRNNDGAVAAFDGDRVMAVFIGVNKNTAAARAALQINYAVREILNVAIKEAYPTTGFRLQQAVGIDTGSLFVARTGIRGSNDLVWIGRAVNYAARLCGLREDSYASHITEEVYNSLDDSLKSGGDPKRDLWEKVMWTECGVAVYRSNWWWEVG